VSTIERICIPAPLATGINPIKPQKNEKSVIPGLDIIRFIAAFMVMSYHLCACVSADEASINYKMLAGRAAFPELFSVTWFGWVGVEIFFVISGLVIVYSAEGASAFAFVWKRALRLYPAAWVCATITAVTGLALGIETNRHLLGEWLASIVLFPRGPWIDVVYWTLGVEIAFYSLIFVLLAIRQFSQLERLAVILGMLSSGYWILGSLVAPHFLQAHLWNRTLELSLLPFGCFFGLGALTYVVFRAGLSPLRVFAIILFASAGLVEVSYRSVDNNFSFHSNQSAVVPQILFAAAVVAIFASLVSTGKFGRRSVRLIRILGLATYPLYLFHQIVGVAIMKVVLIAGAGKYTALAVAICLCVSASIAIAVFLEPPIRTLLRGLLAGITNTIFGVPTNSEPLAPPGKEQPAK
jgi:peptidoglycan/LPS O-acetylase OafA/YrhL